MQTIEALSNTNAFGDTFFQNVDGAASLGATHLSELTPFASEGVPTGEDHSHQEIGAPQIETPADLADASETMGSFAVHPEVTFGGSFFKKVEGLGDRKLQRLSPLATTKDEYNTQNDYSIQ